MMRRSHLSFLGILAMLLATVALAATGEHVVQNLRVEDVPDDDGGGLIVSWTPLPQQDRIIEYRIYRGITPDSLFFISSISVNANTGVASDVMYFYDKDYSGFVDISSPGRLKHEDQQIPGSPLFKEIPRDLNVTGPMLDDFRILGIIPTKEFYYHTYKITYPGEATADTTQKPEDEVWAGLKISQLTMYKKLKANHPYWYTIVAVNESRHYYSYAEPVMGIPRDNAPESIKGGFYPVLVNDHGKYRLQFEWEYPLTKSDVAYFSVYMLPKTDLPAFEAYQQYLKQKENSDTSVLDYRELVVAELQKVIAKLTSAGSVSQATLKSLNEFIATVRMTRSGAIDDEREAVLAKIAKDTPADEAAVRALLDHIKFNPYDVMPKPMRDALVAGQTLTDMTFAPTAYIEAPASMDNPARLVYREMRMLSALPPNVAVVNLDERNHVVDTDWDIDLPIDVNTLEDYCFVLSIYDGAGYETFSNVKTMQSSGPDRNILTAQELPSMPMDFRVGDKPNDKGDYNSVMWGRPVVVLTKTEFVNPTNTRLRVNYDLITNDRFKIRNVYFDLYDDFSEGAKPIQHVNEFYQDNKIELRLPAGMDFKNKPLTLVMSFKTNNDKELGEDYRFVQELRWDTDSRALVPQQLYFGEENINAYSFLVFNQAQQDAQFSLCKKTQGNQRGLDDSVPYEDVVYKSITRYDAEHQMVLVSTALDVIRDQEFEVDLSTDIYESGEDEYKKQVEDLTAQMTEFKTAQQQQVEALAGLVPSLKGEVATMAATLVEAERLVMADPTNEVAKRARDLAWITISDNILNPAQSRLGQIGEQLTRIQNAVEAKLVAATDDRERETYRNELNKIIAGQSAAQMPLMREQQQLQMSIAPFMGLMQTDMQMKQTQEQLLTAQRQLENPIFLKSFGITNNNARIKWLATNRERDIRTYRYYLVKTDGEGRFSMSDVYADAAGNTWFFPIPNWFDKDNVVMLIASLLFAFLVFYMIRKARKGHDLYLRPIAGIQEIDNAIGRATEMGRPILFVPGLSGISDVATLAGLAILGKVAKKAAEYDTRILVPCRDYIVLPIAQSIIREAHYEAGRPDTYDKNSAFFVTTDQFGYVAGVNGIMVREKTATNFYMGMFYAESLIMTESGSITGAIQISGTDAVTQIPFFITTCDYTLIGEELYAAAAYLAREPNLLGTLKAQDYFKFLILTFIIAGTILSTAHATFLINAFPEK